MNKKYFYEVPKVEILMVRVEKGFDVSGSLQDGLSTQQMEGGTGEGYTWN